MPRNGLATSRRRMCVNSHPTVSELSEAALLERAGAGEEPAQRAFLEAHGEEIWRLLFRMTGDYDRAHDLTQETLLRAFRKAGDFEGRGSVRGWLARMAVNLARDHLRKRRRRLRLLEEHGGPEDHHPSKDPLFEERVREAVDGLSDGQRLVVVMHDLEGYTHEEIGEALGIAPGSSRARLSRAREELRTVLAGLRKEFRDA